MKAAILENFKGPLKIKNIPDPQCGPHDVIIEVQACGVCRSDHHAWQGVDPDVKLPHIMGHEFSGIICSIGTEVKGFRIGDRVTAPFILGCGQCPDCKIGQPTICAHQDVIGFNIAGAFAEYVAIPNADYNLAHLPENLTFTDAASMGCRMTTAYQGIIHRAELKAEEWIVIHGCGGVGLSSIMIAKAINARVIAVDLNEDALLKAKELGADHILNVKTSPNIIEEIQHITKGGAHVAVDALGITQTFLNSLKSLRKFGRHVQIGMPTAAHATPEIPLLELVYTNQLALFGTRGMAGKNFSQLFKLINTGKIIPSYLVDEEIHLSQVENRLRKMNDFSKAGVSVVTQMI